jgi:hypothetical protein
VLVLAGGQEAAAIGRSADRVRLPVYLPMSRRLAKRRGRDVVVRRALLPGYGFVLARDIAQHWDHIMLSLTLSKPSRTPRMNY